jgi:alkanesulfonate monooxygenase SsuD/methylene tetrahydromethanopterin reductase-like flavin-dependent oxidoreductase (luciferase family)
LTAKHAEVVFSVALTKEDVQAVYADLKARVVRHGRDPSHFHVLVGVAAYVGRTEAEADELCAELQEAIDAAVGVLRPCLNSVGRTCRAIRLTARSLTRRRRSSA